MPLNSPKTKNMCRTFLQSKKVTIWTITFPKQSLPVVNEVDLLGLYFDSKLFFLLHIKYLKTKCLQAVNLFQIIAHQTCGADQSILLTLYRTLICSKRDYGAIVCALELRREQLSLQYCTKLESYTLNPTHKTVFQLLSSLYRNKPNAMPSFGLRIQTSIPAINVIKLNIAYWTTCYSSFNPLWLVTTSTKLFDLLQSDMMQITKSNTPTPTRDM